MDILSIIFVISTIISTAVLLFAKQNNESLKSELADAIYTLAHNNFSAVARDDNKTAGEVAFRFHHIKKSNAEETMYVFLSKWERDEFVSDVPLSRALASHEAIEFAQSGGSWSS